MSKPDDASTKNTWVTHKKDEIDKILLIDSRQQKKFAM